MHFHSRAEFRDVDNAGVVQIPFEGVSTPPSVVSSASAIDKPLGVFGLLLLKVITKTLDIVVKAIRDFLADRPDLVDEGIGRDCVAATFWHRQASQIMSGVRISGGAKPILRQTVCKWSSLFGLAKCRTFHDSK